MVVKKKWMLIFASITMLLFLAACNDKEDDPEEEIPIVLSDAFEEYPVWFYVHGDPSEPTEESHVRDMFVFEDEHVQQYTMDNIEITLGEVTEYSDEELIAHVQEQLTTASDTYEEPEAKSYTLDLHVDEDGEKTDFMDVVVEDTDIIFTVWNKDVSQTIGETEFLGMIIDGDPAMDEDELYITRVDESSITMELDDPDTTKSIVTVDEWMERQKQKDLESRDLGELDPEELEEIENHPGADIYAQSCLACHGENLEGTAAPELTLAGERFSKEELKDIIQNGTGNMPAIIVDNEEDADVLAAWLSEYMTD